MTNEEAKEIIEPLCLALASDENFECYGDCNDCKDKHARRLEEAKKLAIKSLELMNAYDMAIKALEQQPCDDAVSRKFVEIVISYPQFCVYEEYKGKPYFSIKYTENGQEFIGFGTYKLEVLSEYLRNYFMTPQQTSWIPVSERLPKTDEDVLVTNGTGMYVGWIDDADKGWRVDSGNEYFMNDILAWMPLPQPYKAESEDAE